MDKLYWVKENWEFCLGVFSFGGLYNAHKNHGKEIDSIKADRAKLIEKNNEDMEELKTGMATLLERTKHL